MKFEIWDNKYLVHKHPEHIYLVAAYILDNEYFYKCIKCEARCPSMLIDLPKIDSYYNSVPPETVYGHLVVYELPRKVIKLDL